MKTRYGNKKIEYEGLKFDSKLELQYYTYLKKRYPTATVILQPKFILQDGFVYKGRKILPITYTADFDITYDDGNREIIDIKGHPSIEAHLKKKMFRYRYPELDLKWVVYVKKRGGRIDWEDNKKAKRAEKKAI